MFNLINNYRVQNGVPALEHMQELENTAQACANRNRNNDANTDYCFDSIPGEWWGASAFGSANNDPLLKTPEQVFANWTTNTSLRNSILASGRTYMGVGYAFDNTGSLHNHWIVHTARYTIN